MGLHKKNLTEIIQTFQNKVRVIVNAPWYIHNNDLHRALYINLITDEIKKNAIKHNQRLQTHENPEMGNVLDIVNNVRWLKRTKPCELVEWNYIILINFC